MKSANSTICRDGVEGGNKAASRCETVWLIQIFRPVPNNTIASVKSPMRFCNRQRRDSRNRVSTAPRTCMRNWPSVRQGFICASICSGSWFISNPLLKSPAFYPRPCDSAWPRFLAGSRQYRRFLGTSDRRKTLVPRFREDAHPGGSRP